MAVTTATHTITSASALRRGASGHELFAANKGRGDSVPPKKTAPNGAAAAISAASTGGRSTLQKLSGGARLVAPRDELVTARLESRLASEIQVLNQANKNAGQVAAILQTASQAVTRIDTKLSRMAELADEAAGHGVSDSQRAVLNNEFAELRAKIDDIAGAARFSDSTLLNGTNSFTATSIGANIQSADGIQAFIFDSRAGDEFVAAGDSIAITYDSGTKIFRVTNLSSGRGAVSQALTSAPAPGETREITIADFGLAIQVNSQFSTTADITADNLFQVGGGANNQVDLSLRIGSGVAGGSDEISANLQRVRVATLSSPLQHDDILSVAAALGAAANVKSAQDTLDRFQTGLKADLTRVGVAVANLENGVSNFESANASLSALAAAARDIEGALHDVVAKTAGAILAEVNQIPDILAQLQGLAGMVPSTTSAQPRDASKEAVRDGGADKPVSSNSGTDED